MRKGPIRAKTRVKTPGLLSASAEIQQKLLIAAAIKGDVAAALNALKSFRSVLNIPEEETGMTALHYAAAYNALPLMRELIKFANLNYTIKDRKGRTPATLAIEIGGNPTIGRFLLKKEYEQGGRKNPTPSRPNPAKPG